MKQSDFKITSIVRTNSATIIRVRFYEGETKPQIERKDDGEKMVTRYRRSAMVSETEFGLGGVWTDEELSDHLRKQLKKDTSRSPLPDEVLR